MDHFPLLYHQRAGGGIDCTGTIIIEESERESMATLRCDDCGVVVGTINRWILRDLATDLDEWQPRPEHFNRLPAPLQTYIHDLETRADPAGDVKNLALARMTIAALQQRIRELEAR
jgi:hypothetical protein